MIRIPRHTHTVGRLEALSDGVYSIAITLLSIDVIAAVKHMEEGQSLGAHLLHEWPVIVAYLIGFVTLMVCWINHHRVFQFVGRADGGLIWINGINLLLVAAVPIPTALLAEHIQGPNAMTAIPIYLSTFVLMPLSFWLILLYVHNRQLANAENDNHGYLGMRWMYFWVTLWNGLALAIGYFVIWPALAMLAAAFIVFAFPTDVSRVVTRWMSRPSA